ncbi:hypothetical protein Hamer_G021493 [Homarus americanus]|uniref:Uncharacterized protein n=1 Tax=Homarus americanus TaxID=6706 RepID=A0A8J5K3G5_HOMAM|nr:hypothetical protein Hamer_G021493 [Homarus americanus]
MDAYSLAELAVLLWIQRLKHKRRTRIWMHELNTKGPNFGSFSHLFPDLVNHQDKFYNFFRMTVENFKKLVDLTGSSRRKMTTNYRRAAITSRSRWLRSVGSYIAGRSRTKFIRTITYDNDYPDILENLPDADFPDINLDFLQTNFMKPQ